MLAQIERGAGARLDYRLFEDGDVRCNRVAHGYYVGQRWHQVLDPDNARDLAVRDAFFRYFGAVNFTGATVWVLGVRALRVALRHPAVVPIAGPGTCCGKAWTPTTHGCGRPSKGCRPATTR